MIVKITFAALRTINVGRWLVYEAVSGVVTKTANVSVGPGWAPAECIFQLEPPIAIAMFRERFPESVEVIEIMAGAGNGSVVTSPLPNALTLNAQEVNISPANTAQQLPALVIPDGRSVVIKSEQGNGNNVFVSDSAANVAIVTSRYRLRSGDFITLKVANLDEVWVLSPQNNQKIEVIVEQ